MAQANRSRPFTARHPGWCHWGRHEFAAGSQIQYVKEKTVCVSCARGQGGSMSARRVGTARVRRIIR